MRHLVGYQPYAGDLPAIYFSPLPKTTILFQCERHLDDLPLSASL